MAIPGAVSTGRSPLALLRYLPALHLLAEFKCGSPKLNGLLHILIIFLSDVVGYEFDRIRLRRIGKAIHVKS